MCWGKKRMDHHDGLKCKDVGRLFRKKEENVARGKALMKVEQRGQMSGWEDGRKSVMNGLDRQTDLKATDPEK